MDDETSIIEVILKDRFQQRQRHKYRIVCYPLEDHHHKHMAAQENPLKRNFNG